MKKYFEDWFLMVFGTLFFWVIWLILWLKTISCPSPDSQVMEAIAIKCDNYMADNRNEYCDKLDEIIRWQQYLIDKGNDEKVISLDMMTWF